MNPQLRQIGDGLWLVAGLIVAGAVVFFILFVHYDYSSAYDQWNRASTRRNLERIQREDRISKAKQAAEVAAHDAYLARVTALNTQVESKWREDVESARVTAQPGVVPPMLGIQEKANYVTVSNKLHDQAVCVQLARVARRSKRVNDYDRCHLDVDTCRELLPQTSYRFILYSTGNPPECMKAPLEFRVGSPFSPEPSWWSRSALEDFDARPPPEPLRTQSLEMWPLGGSEQALKDLLSEKDRALRWRREFGPKIDTTRVEN